MEPAAAHRPVMVREVLELLDLRPDGIYIDVTLGGGGHARAILERLDRGRLLAIDQDPQALTRARDHLRGQEQKLVVMEGNFAQIDVWHAASGLALADGVVADLGMSSLQLADETRGFSFSRPDPLDMRMSPNTEITADEIVNQTGERELADLLFKLGEERHSRRIARAIVKARPIRTATELAQVVTRALPSRAGLHPMHPATRTFMALRLAVNRELENLEAFLARVLTVLRPGGRVVVLSYHSLEDRLVKHTFRRWQSEGQARLVTRKALRPSEAEVEQNPRSRSARLRAVEKIGQQEL